MKAGVIGPLIVAIAVMPAMGRDRAVVKHASQFQTSDRCVACHNGLTKSDGTDISIGFQWRASAMANSSRDPYWQASVRRETMDHPESRAQIEDECAICHMPIVRYDDKTNGKLAQIFLHLPFQDNPKRAREASDGVSCSVCHQISKEKLGTRESMNGGFVIAPAANGLRTEYGPFEVDRGHQRIMRSSTAGYQPAQSSDHIRESELCATCHTLYTDAIGPGGKVVGTVAEQAPYQEWLNSDYRNKQTCQSCHMPVVEEPVAITRVFGVPRTGTRRHVFLGGNFFLTNLLNLYRDELETAALPAELSAAASETADFLRRSTARLTITGARTESGRFLADVLVDNLAGHKLPSAYPSRRAWLHVTVRDGGDRVVFESGALRGDGSIAGNDNDSDPSRYERHYSEITSSDQVQIYEDILGDINGKVTTGLLAGVGYLKDNRLLPHGFNKSAAGKDIAVMGDASGDANFTGEGHRIRYAVPLGNASGPFRVEAELWYQPVGYRWATNLKAYGTAVEPARFTRYYDASGRASAMLLVREVRSLDR